MILALFLSGPPQITKIIFAISVKIKPGLFAIFHRYSFLYWLIIEPVNTKNLGPN